MYNFEHNTSFYLHNRNKRGTKNNNGVNREIFYFSFNFAVIYKVNELPLKLIFTKYEENIYSIREDIRRIHSSWF